MKAIYSLFILSCVALSSSIGQIELGPCGTPSYKTKWLKEYQKAPEKYSLRSAELLYVPVSINLVGSTQNTGYIGESKLFKSIVKLNQDFIDSDIQFYIKDGFKFIPNSQWVVHNDYEVGADMMFTNNIEHAINCYFVTDPAGNCGYNLPYAGIALASSCVDPEDDTWAHEIGHNLSLPHPFLGWEGGVKHDGSVAPNYDAPAPEYVTYDYTVFQSVQYTSDTLIIDTAFVEKVDGSNCNFAADGFCDTDPDYLVGGLCNATTSRSRTQQTDPNGEQFTSDASLIMAYFGNECGSRFTPDQMAAMRANLIDEKGGYLIGNDPPPNISSAPTLIGPLGGEKVDVKEVKLEWEAVENAMYYLVEISRGSTVSGANHDTITMETNYSISDLRVDKKYYWKITPFTSHQFNASPSIIESFETAEITSTRNESELKPFKLNGNTFADGQSLSVQFEALPPSGEIQLYDLNGRVVSSQPLTKLSHQVDFEQFMRGIYILNVRIGKSSWSEKILKL